MSTDPLSPPADVTPTPDSDDGLEVVSEIHQNDLLLNYGTAGENQQVYVVHFDEATEVPSVKRLGSNTPGLAALKNSFNDGLVMGVPEDHSRRPNASYPGDGAFRLNLDRLNAKVQAWLTQQSQENAAQATDDSQSANAADPADDGPSPGGDAEALPGSVAHPFDVVFSRVSKKEGDVEKVYIVHCGDSDKPGHPRDVEVADDEASVEAVLTLFQAGTYLSFLQQTTFPIGFTCYLLNTSYFM